MDGDFFESAQPLKEILLETKDGEWGKDQADDGLVEMIVIRGTDFGDARQCELSRIPRRFILQKAADRKTLRPNDILIETAGGSKGRPTGRTVFLRPTLFECSPLPITCASFARFLRVNTDLAVPEYVYWFLQALYASGEIERHQVQHSGIARFQYTKFAAETLVPLPSREHQRDISEFLGLVERRITLLRETNATLEAIAQALFKSWFVDFDPVRAKVEGREPEGVPPEVADLFPDELVESELGLIPKGWGIQPIEALSSKVGMGPFGSNIKVSTFVDQGVPVISGQHLHGVLLEEKSFNFITDEHASRLANSLVGEGDVIFTHAGNIGQVSLIPSGAMYQTYILSQRQFYLRCDKNKLLPAVAVYFFRSRNGQHALLSNASQVGVPSIARPVSHLRNIKMAVPPIEVQHRFDNVVGALHGKLVANRKQDRSLTDLRDTLLPRLMSGKLRIAEAEKELEAV